MDYQSLGHRIRRRRQELHWTQEQLAEKIGVSTSFIGHIERASRKASIDTLVDIANAMKVTTDYLLAGSVDAAISGSLPDHLSENQRLALNEIFATMQSQLERWNDPSEDEP